MRPRYMLPADHGSQMSLGGVGPQPGQRYRNIHSGIMLTVLEVRPGRRTWLKVRMRNSESDMQLATLMTYWQPYDGAGPLR